MGLGIVILLTLGDNLHQLLASFRRQGFRERVAEKLEDIVEIVGVTMPQKQSQAS